MSKEEIEKAKERVNNLGKSIQANCKEKSNIATSIETFLQYTKELEADNYELNNRLNEYIEEREKQNKIIDETINYIASLDIEEDICEEIGKTDCDKMVFGECESCLKQYFEKKVEGK